MKEDFTDRLLDSALKRYSSVEVPEGFAARLAARQEMGNGRRRWWWMLIPAAATLAIVLVLWPRPEVVTPAPKQVTRVQPPTPILQPPAQTQVRRVTAYRAKPRWRTLSAVELASADFPLEILRPMEQKPIKDLEVPALEIKPLAGAEEETVPTIPKEPQR